MSALLTNGITLWLRWIAKKLWLYIKQPVDTPWLDYMADVSGSVLGKKVSLYKYARVVNSSIGDYTYIAKHTHVTNARIGKFCSIGQYVWIGLGKHPTNTFVSTHPVFYSSRRQIKLQWVNRSEIEEFGEINIGNDVWIGANAMIMDSITIGNGAVIGAGAIVTKDVPAYAVVAGVPAKIIRYRFSEADINLLQKSEWWNRDIKWIQHRKDFLDIAAFIKTLKAG
jgi:acetyltransferase-like isoleucine patch superfamily enzyme